MRGWTRPVAWLAPALTLSGALLFSALLLPSFGEGSAETGRTFVDTNSRLTTAGVQPDPAAPVVTDVPIWLPYSRGGTAVALPYEPPTSVLDLAHRFHAAWVVSLTTDNPFRFAIERKAEGAECFQEVTTPPTPALGGHAPDTLRVYRVVCP